MRAHGSARGVAVLNATTEFQALSRSPVDTALIEGKRANMADMAMAFSLDPLAALGISMGNSATYTSAIAWFEKLRQDLMVWVTAVEELMSSLLPAGRGVRMDFTELTRPDPKTQYEALQVAVNAGLLTIDEARNSLGLPSLPEQPEPEPATPPPAAPPEPPAEPPAEPEPETQRASRFPSAWRH
jgi:phage portal protein BeeE